MPGGPGKYHAFAVSVREQTHAEGVIVAVVNGDLGSGFSVQGSPAFLLSLPKLLRSTADDIEKALDAGQTYRAE